MAEMEFLMPSVFQCRRRFGIARVEGAGLGIPVGASRNGGVTRMWWKTETPCGSAALTPMLYHRPLVRLIEEPELRRFESREGRLCGALLRRGSEAGRVEALYGGFCPDLVTEGA
jgi:hypothetical protein